MKKMIEAGIQVNCIVTSPPYFGLRRYVDEDIQIGLEPTVSGYIHSLVGVFSLCKNLLSDDGTLWINIGDSYSGSGNGRNADGSPSPSALKGKQGTHKGSIASTFVKPIDTIPSKNLYGIPWRLAFALQDNGWILRNEIIWHKRNQMPHSVKDRLVVDHETVFLLSKTKKYYFDHEAIKEPAVTKDGRPSRMARERMYEYNSKERANPEAYLRKTPKKRDPKEIDDTDRTSMRSKRTVWSINTQPRSSGGHVAAFPEALVEPCILAGSRVGDVVFDPFLGSGTVAQVAKRYGRNWLGCELNKDNAEIQKERINKI
jgi:DNA modification methylase